jgi:hypothetical protein
MAFAVVAGAGQVTFKSASVAVFAGVVPGSFVRKVTVSV